MKTVFFMGNEKIGEDVLSNLSKTVGVGKKIETPRGISEILSIVRFEDVLYFQLGFPKERVA